MWVWVLGCRVDSGGARGEIAATAGWSTLVPSVATVGFFPPEGARSWVEYGRGDALDQATPATLGHSIAVLGLASGGSYRYRVVSERDGERWESPVGVLDVPVAPVSVPRLLLGPTDPSAVAPTGFVLGATVDDPAAPTEAWVVIWNGDGEPVWWWRHAPGQLSTAPWVGATPGTIGWDAVDPSALGSRVYRARLDGTELLPVSLDRGHGPASEIEPGVVAWVGRDLRSLSEGTWTDAESVFESPIGASAATEPLIDLAGALWGDGYTAPCDHPLTPRIVEGDSVYSLGDASSLVPLDDSLLVHVRWFDTTLRIDRATGEVVWRLGGPWSDFALPDGSPTWTEPGDSLTSHGYVSDAWEGGMVMFDDGIHRDPPVASVVELAWDEEAHTVEEVRRFNDPLGRAVTVLGDARRLPGDHLLASWSTLGELNEVDADGVEQWRAYTTPPRAVSRVRWIADLYAP